MSTDQKLSLLVDHYTDTFGQLQKYRAWRDRTFVFLVIAVIFMLFQAYTPGAAGDLLYDVLSNSLGTKISLDANFVSSVVWFAFLGLSVRYFQAVTTVERTYKYIHGLEDLISPSYQGKAFTREGASYSQDQSWFSGWTSVLYTVIFPCLLAIIALGRIIGEIRQYQAFSLVFAADFVLAALCVITIGLYTLFVYTGK